MGSDVVDDFLASGSWVKSLTHALDDHDGRAVAHDVFAQPRRTGGTDFVVDVEARSQDGGVPHAPWILATGATGRGSAAQVSIGIQGQHGDGIVTAFSRISLDLTSEPGRLQSGVLFDIDRLDPVFEGEPARALADQHDVGRVLHHRPRDADRIDDSLHGRDTASAVVGAVHDRSVELRVARRVGTAFEADGAVGGETLDQADALLDTIEQGATLSNAGERTFGGLLAERPGSDEERALGRIHGRRCGAAHKRGAREEPECTRPGTCRSEHATIAV